MNIATEPKPQQQRRIRYIDRNLQKRLIIGLVVMEVMLIITALVLLSGTFDQILEGGIYRIHPDSPQVIAQQLMTALGWTLLALTLINIVMLILADRFWAAHLQRVLSGFRSRTQHISALDLRPIDDDLPNHELSHHSSSWFESERQRCLKIEQALTTLTESISEPERAKQQLSTLRKLIR